MATDVLGAVGNARKEQALLEEQRRKAVLEQQKKPHPQSGR